MGSVQESTFTKTIAGKHIGPIGYGLMGITSRQKLPMDEGVKLMKAALDHGANFWNGGTFYGPSDANSLHLVKAYVETYPEDEDKIVLSIKGAYDRPNLKPDCSPEGIRASVETALETLNGSKSIDLFQCARVDPEVPIEETVQTLAQLIDEGKIGSYGLSEANATTIQRAHVVHPVGAVEIELSMFSRHVLGPGGVAETCKALGIPLVAYSPLDRGWLTGDFKSYSDLLPGDFRHKLPRFQPDAFEKNLKLANAALAVAERKGCSGAQVAIAWVREQGAIPIPGVTRLEKVVENCTEVQLKAREMEEIEDHLENNEVVGHRYPEAMRKQLDQ